MIDSEAFERACSDEDAIDRHFRYNPKSKKHHPPPTARELLDYIMSCPTIERRRKMVLAAAAALGRRYACGCCDSDQGAAQLLRDVLPMVL